MWSEVQDNVEGLLHTRKLSMLSESLSGSDVVLGRCA